ncbi:MAG: beta-lactamase family protein [Bdellovibrionales bacterium]|nr:beta-lactamase family protein [Bdellovibrionales bacterium]
MNKYENKFQGFIKDHQSVLERATPSLRVQVYQSGRKMIDTHWGRWYFFYDLASLTKIIFSASASMKALDLGMFSLENKVIDLWPEYGKTSSGMKKSVHMKMLLTHTAGLPWWKPFFKDLQGSFLPEKRWQQLVSILFKVKLKFNKQAVYSDLSLLFLGQILTQIHGKNLLEIWNGLMAQADWGQLHFNEKNQLKFSQNFYAPTEHCDWRKKELQGEVHDENAWALGGVAPHAGLFGRVEDVAQWALWVRKILKGEIISFIKSSTMNLFTQRQLPRFQGDWGYLFMKPTLGKSSCGRFFSRKSFGHTGFTGTSVWFDPVKDRIVIVLSNRICPTRDNREFVRLRPQIHNWIVQSLDSE